MKAPDFRHGDEIGRERHFLHVDASLLMSGDPRHFLYVGEPANRSGSPPAAPVSPPTEVAPLVAG